MYVLKYALGGVLVLSAAVLAFSEGPAGEAGKVTRVISRAELLRGQSVSALKEGDPVVENDRVRTQSSGLARLSLIDGSILNIGRDSLLTIQLSPRSSRTPWLEMRYGQLRALVASHSGQSQVEIRTGTAVCGVLGTTLFVDATRDVTRVANLSDEPQSRVRVRSIAQGVSGEVILLPGQGTSVPARRAPQPPRTWSPEEVRDAKYNTDIP